MSRIFVIIAVLLGSAPTIVHSQNGDTTFQLHLPSVERDSLLERWQRGLPETPSDFDELIDVTRTEMDELGIRELRGIRLYLSEQGQTFLAQGDVDAARRHLKALETLNLNTPTRFV